MSLNKIVGLNFLVAVAACGTASAQQAYCPPACGPDGNCAQNFHYSFYRNAAWPMPFRAMDTAAVTSIFEAQRNNGWKLSNTIGAAMYAPGTHELTDAGKAHLRWVVTQAPENRRVVFVRQGANQAVTAKRVESTQLAISELIPVGPLPQLYLTQRDAPMSSGEYQTTVLRALTSSVPPPRLPAQQGNAGVGTP